MKESTTYQAILKEGATEGAINEARKLLLQLGSEQLGRPSPRTQAVVAKIADLGRLEALIGRLRVAENWQTLLAKAPADR